MGSPSLPEICQDKAADTRDQDYRARHYELYSKLFVIA
jgi:hypothetical protein